jgi:hypothetical protein
MLSESNGPQRTDRENLFFNRVLNIFCGKKQPFFKDWRFKKNNSKIAN